MTAYLSANLRHTDKRLQQSGPAVVALRHRVRARRGARLMNIYEVGGVMTSSLCLGVPLRPAGLCARSPVICTDITTKADPPKRAQDN